jgi:UDP-2-acetamido-3-amino-2,3-dideoxy-glucuronate N-acetyltransferase
MLGVPAVQKGWVSKTGAVLGKDLKCPETGEHYQIENGQLKLLL